MEEAPQLVPRPTLVIGDLHGSMRALEGNLKGANALDSNGAWAHKERDLVFLGDAVCDRGRDDLEVSSRINVLREQVQAAGGTCITLAGNHELTGLYFLLGDMDDYNSDEKFGRQHEGIRALTAAATGLRSDKINDLVQQRKNTPDFLQKFKESPEGQEVIRYYGNLELFARSGKVLFTHTPANENMLRTILDEGNAVNTAFTTVLKNSLGIPGMEPTKHQGESFRKTERQFLDGDNRKATVPDGNHPIWTECKAAGIGVHLFGHDYKSHGDWPTHPEVLLCGLDYHYTLPIGTKQCSGAWLYPEGGIKGFEN